LLRAWRRKEEMVTSIPTWILEAEVEKSAKLVRAFKKNDHNKELLKIATDIEDSPAFIGLANLLNNNPRRRRTWYESQFRALVDSDAAIRDSLVRDYIRDNACSALKLK
jgi:hypothetical protein